MPISGWMADRYGARRVFLAAIAVFTVSSVLCGLSSTLDRKSCSGARSKGIGGAMMTPVGRVIVVKSVPRFEIVRAMNYVTIPAVLAPLIGPSVGGFIVTYFSWPWIFFLNLPIGIAGLILVYLYVPDLREDKVAPLDLRGFVLIGLALAGLVFGFAAHRTRRAADAGDHRIDQHRCDLRRALSRACAAQVRPDHRSRRC